jgi:Zn-dependent protease
MICPQCGVELPPNLLVCPSCHALVHAAELKTLAGEAEAATAAGNYSDALANWRSALELLPPASAQHGVISARVNELVQRLERPTQAELPKKPKWANKGGVLGAIGLVLWKLKFVVLFVLTKAKLLLLGLTKAGTFFSMLLSLGVYWSLWGWKFALGFVLSIYVHEMGHIYQLRRYGIKSTVPMFIPGLGAVIRSKLYPVTPHEEARVGLAGPIWGTFAAGFCYAIFLLTGSGAFAPIARFGAWVNLFNLLPVWQLDGSHAFKALSKLERAIVAAVMLAMFLITKDGLLLLLIIVAAFRCFEKTAPQKRDSAILTEFAFLVVTLSLLATIGANEDRQQPVIESVPLTSTAAVAESRMFAEARPVFAPAYGRPTGTSLPLR